MNLLPIIAADRLAVVGISGTGKSNAAKKYIAAQLERGVRVVAFDPEDEWSKKGRASGQVRLGPLAERVAFEDFDRDPGRWLDLERLSLAVVPSDVDAEAGEQFEGFVENVKHSGSICVVVEEVGGLMRDNRGAQNAAIKLATKGRHWGDDGCPSLWVSQRMVDIPAGARAQLTQLETFLQTQEADLAALADRVDSTFAEQVKHLPPGESLFWCVATRKEKS